MKLIDYISNLNFVFEEFDMEEFDGSYWESDGVLSDKFTNDEITDALSGYDWTEETPVENLTDEDIDDAVGAVVNMLDQGSIKYLKIYDGDKILYEDSNDEPFED